MTKKDEFTNAEIAAAAEERAIRTARNAAYKKQWYLNRRNATPDKTKAENAAYQKSWRAKNRTKARQISRLASAKYAQANPLSRRVSSRAYNARIRSEMFAFFGGICVRCGFSDSRALHMDHIHGGGKKARDEGRHGLYARWKMTKDDPVLARETFQLLCANCNFIKRDEEYEYGRRARLARAVTEAAEKS